MGSSPTNHSWDQTTRDTGLPDGEDRIPCFDTIPDCDGQTDRRMDGLAIAYTALAKLYFAERSNKTKADTAI